MIGGHDKHKLFRDAQRGRYIERCPFFRYVANSAVDGAAAELYFSGLQYAMSSGSAVLVHSASLPGKAYAGCLTCFLNAARRNTASAPSAAHRDNE
jgi:hypothetical protein